MSTMLRSLGLLDLLSSAPAGPSVTRRLAKRRIHARLRRLATKPGEECGLIVPQKEKNPPAYLNRPHHLALPSLVDNSPLPVDHRQTDGRRI